MRLRPSSTALSTSSATERKKDLSNALRIGLARTRSPLAQIEFKSSAERQRKGTEPLGRAAILLQDPHGKPARSKKSPAPRFHAFRKSVRWELYEGYSRFVARFREASEKLRTGELTAKFPIGSFPPALPFVS
jgi:hypothetical protein